MARNTGGFGSSNVGKQWWYRGAGGPVVSHSSAAFGWRGEGMTEWLCQQPLDSTGWEMKRMAKMCYSYFPDLLPTFPVRDMHQEPHPFHEFKLNVNV